MRRPSNRGQALAYTGICMVAFFSLAAAAVDLGRHIYVGREVQVVADAQALAAATALARSDGDPSSAAYQAAVKTFAQRNAIEGATAQTVTPVPGHWDPQSGTFAAGSPYNAVQSTASFTVSNIFALWSASGTLTRQAVAAFIPAPLLPVALCNRQGGWYPGVDITFKVSNGTETANTAGWAIYDPNSLQFNNTSMMAVAAYLPAACGGSMRPPQELIGTSLLLGNGVGNLFNAACETSATGLAQCLPGQTFMLPIANIACGGPMNMQQTIIGFVTARIDSVGCQTNSAVCGAAGGPCIIGHVDDSCATKPSPAACPVATLVR